MFGTYKELLKKYFTQQDLDEIAKVISEQERFTSGEIRVSIRAKRGWTERKNSLQELALKEFYRLKMNLTKDRSGVLLFFLFEEHQFYILADEGIHLKADSLWDSVAQTVSENFKVGKYVEGISQAVQSIGKTLAQHYPRKTDDTNELSNQVELN
ncbi:MAG: TPM domain-containing protein [Ignavibacteriae bacterium]|nr:TPM domain-containing protein [Ignavibacteriota bacterium]